MTTDCFISWDLRSAIKLGHVLGVRSMNKVENHCPKTMLNTSHFCIDTVTSCLSQWLLNRPQCLLARRAEYSRGPGFKARLGRSFRCDWTSRHAMRLNSQDRSEGSPVSSLNCDRPLHSGSGAVSYTHLTLPTKRIV